MSTMSVMSSASSRQLVRRLIAKALPLTLGGLVTLLGLAILVAGVSESFLMGRRDYRYSHRSIGLRTDGHLQIITRTHKGSSFSTLDAKPLEKHEASMAFFSVLDQTLKSQRSSDLAVEVARQTERRVYYFQHKAQRGVYVKADRKTRRIEGYLGKNGFQQHAPKQEDWFDLADQPIRSRLDHSWRFHGPRHLDLQGASFNTISSNELLLQSDGKQLWLIDLEADSAQLIHQSKVPIRAVSWMREGLKSETYLALYLNDVLEVRSVKAPTQVVLRTRVPHEVQGWKSFNWVPAKYSATETHIFVRAQSQKTRIVWSDSKGTVTQNRDFELNPELDREGERYTLPPMVGWMMGVLQCPTFSASMVGFVNSLDETRGQFDKDAFSLEISGITGDEKRRNTYRGMVLPILVTLLVSFCWQWAAQRRLRVFGASSTERWFWGVWITLTGLPGYLAFHAHRPWPALASCTACARATPLNQPCCLQCGHTFAVSPATATPVSKEARQRRRWRPSFGMISHGLEVLEACALSVVSRFGGSGAAVLTVKELRALAIPVALAALAYLWLVGSILRLPILSAFGSRGWVEPPFVSPRGYGEYILITIGSAVAFGFWQTLTEGFNGAWLFLLHRPVTRRTVVVSKLLTGWALLWGLGAASILVMGWWASFPGRFMAPFEWWMTRDFWIHWWLAPLWYLAAFVVGLRPARWWATRLLPLVAVYGLHVWGYQLEVDRWPLWQGALVSAAVMWGMVVVILTISRERDFS